VLHSIDGRLLPVTDSSSLNLGGRPTLAVVRGRLRIVSPDSAVLELVVRDLTLARLPCDVLRQTLPDGAALASKRCDELTLDSSTTTLAYRGRGRVTWFTRRLPRSKFGGVDSVVAQPGAWFPDSLLVPVLRAGNGQDDQDEAPRWRYYVFLPAGS